MCIRDRRLHQPAIGRGAGLEPGHRAEIDQAGVHRLAAPDLVEGFFRSEAQADIFDIDDGAIVHLDGVFRLEFGQAVGTNHLVIRAALADPAMHPLAEKFAAEDRDHPAAAVAEVPGLDRRPHLDRKTEGIAGGKRGSHDITKSESYRVGRSPIPACAAATRSPAAETGSGSPGGSGR